MREWFHSRFSFPFIDRFILAFLKQLKIKKDFIMLCNKHVISHILSHLILLVMLQLVVRTVSVGHPTASRAQPNVKHLEGSQIYLFDEWLPKMSFFFFYSTLWLNPSSHHLATNCFPRFQSPLTATQPAVANGQFTLIKYKNSPLLWLITHQVLTSPGEWHRISPLPPGSASFLTVSGLPVGNPSLSVYLMPT